MTAINPAKLRIQTAALAELVNQPDQFAIQLHDLLAFYSARIRRSNLSQTSLSLQAYQVPDPVLSALRKEIMERLEEDPALGFSLVDGLWKEPWLEHRHLAIQILGILPLDDSDQILNRVLAWLETCPTEEIRRMIMTEGMKGLAEKLPDLSLHLMDLLISKGSKEALQSALFGLESFAGNPAYLNLPLLYRYISRILLLIEDGLVKEISALLILLASRSEQETTYFLQEQLGSNPNPSLLRVTRKVMRGLSPEYQRLLREKMETHQS